MGDNNGTLNRKNMYDVLSEDKGGVQNEGVTNEGDDKVPNKKSLRGDGILIKRSDIAKAKKDN